MIHTTDLNFAGILIALGLGRLSRAVPPQNGGRLVTFELAVSDDNLERAAALEIGYNDLALLDPSRGGERITLGEFLDAIQRARRAMRAAVQR